MNRQQLAAAAKLRTTEIPGLAYSNDSTFAISYASEVPIVDHYLQQPNCSFVQVKKVLLSSIQLFFWGKVVKQNGTDMTSFCMQFEKLRSGLLREDFRRKGECVVSRKKGGK